MATRLNSGEVHLTSLEAKTLIFLHGDFARDAHRLSDEALDAIIVKLIKIARQDAEAAASARRSRPSYAPKGRATREERETAILAQQTMERLVLAQWLRRFRAKNADARATLDQIVSSRQGGAMTSPDMLAIRAAVAAAAASPTMEEAR